MTWLNPAAVDGALLRSAIVRVLAYAATSGSEGIVSLGDCKVVTTASPSSSIRVLEGGVLVKNRYLGAPGQTYAAYNDAADTVPTTTTGGGARSDLVVLRINDPEFEGSVPPGEEETYPYAQVEIIVGVPSNTQSAASLSLGYPAVALARIDRPASTSVVSSGHIVDLRDLAQPRTKEFLNHISINDGGTNPLNTTGFQPWPILAQYSFYVPTWAVRAKVTGFIEGLRLEEQGAGALRVILWEGGVATEQTNINENPPTNALDRRTYNIGGEIAIPEAVRGTNVTFKVQGKANSSDVFGFLKTDNNSSASLRILLEEVPT